jgi:hypothetical protein
MRSRDNFFLEKICVFRKFAPMTPGDLTIPISRGATWSFEFAFVTEDTGDPVDLTGLGPFVCEVKSINANRLLATATVTSDYDATGLVTVTLSAAQTLALPIGAVRMGMKDAEDNPLFEGSPEVVWFTPT